MAERMKNPKINLMTQYTYERLLQEVEGAKGSVKDALLRIGEAAGSESDWHDNSAFDFANIQHDVSTSQLGSIEAKLRDVQIIEPSRNTGHVNIGNSVVVKFQGETEEETFTVLGPADSGRQQGWISCESPLGSNLIGKKKGDDVTFSAGGQNQKIKVLNILQGDF